MSEAAHIKSPYNVKNPFIAHLKHSRVLTGAGAAKDTRHYEIDLTGSGMEFLPGDSLAVQPTNDPALVDSVIKALELTGDETVPNPKGGETTLRQALIEIYSITEFDGKLIKAVAEKAGNTELAALTTPEKKEALKTYLWGRDVLDVLQENVGTKLSATEFVAVLRKLNIRLYSISSSLKACPEQVHLTVATVKYESHGRIRGSVYTAMRDFVKAREAFEKAQTLTPNAFEPKFNIAELSYVEQKYPEAEAAFTKLLQENPKLREEVRHLSQFKVLVSQLKQGKVAEAEKTSLVFTFMDDTPAYYFSKAAFEFQKDNKDGAREWLVKTDKIYKPQQNAVYLDTLMEARWIPSLTVPSDPKK